MRRDGQAGFTLLEVLVALFVLAIVVTAVLQLFGGGLRLARASGDHVQATLLAGAKLSETPLDALEEGVTQGREDGYEWTRRVALEPDLLPLDPTQPETARIRLARVTVEVRWGANRRVELVTLRTWVSRT